jgi:hypothetical protein
MGLNVFAEDDVEDSGHPEMEMGLIHIEKSSVKKPDLYFIPT